MGIRRRRRITHFQGNACAVPVRKKDQYGIIPAGQAFEPIRVQPHTCARQRIIRSLVQDAAAAQHLLYRGPCRYGHLNARADLIQISQINTDFLRDNARLAGCPDFITIDGRTHTRCQLISGNSHTAGKTYAIGIDIRLINRAVASYRSLRPRLHIVNHGVIRRTHRRFTFKVQAVDFRIYCQRDAAVPLHQNVSEARAAQAQPALIKRRSCMYFGLCNTGSARCSNLQQAPHRRGHDYMVTRRIHHCNRTARDNQCAIDLNIVQRNRIRTYAFRDI